MIGALIAKRKAMAALEAMNRGDLENYLHGWADDGTFVFPGNVEGASGTHIGKDAIGRWMQHFFEQFPSRSFNVKHIAVSNLFDLTGNNVVAIHWELDLTNRKGVKTHGTGVTLVTIRNGKATRAQDFIFDVGDLFGAE